MRRLLKNQSGFTLIELLIVVLIIGVLAGIAVPRVASRSDDAKATACKANMKEIETALEAYYLDHHAYPPTGNWTDPIKSYLKTIPECPAGGYYKYEATDNGFKLTCSKHPFEVTDTSENWNKQ